MLAITGNLLQITTANQKSPGTDRIVFITFITVPEKSSSHHTDRL
jgi:hypothetical protein